MNGEELKAFYAHWCELWGQQKLLNFLAIQLMAGFVTLSLPLSSPSRLPLPARSIKLYKIAPDLGRLLLNAPRHLAPVSCRTPPPFPLSSLLLLPLHRCAHVVHAVHGKSGVVVVASVESAAQIGCGLRGLLADPTGLTSHF